jgi:succinate dehydrogenase/fumarate reductase flavoprotein subunit
MSKKNEAFKKKQKKISRRTFLAGVTVASAALGASLSGCSEPTAGGAEIEKANWMPEKWDREVDVVVLGTGSIIPAALRAHDNGLEVLILEKHPTYFGGTTTWCGGAVSSPNHPVTLGEGMEPIPRDLLKQYLEECAAGQSKDELIEMMLDNYIPAVDYLGNECGYDLRPFTPNTPGAQPGYMVYQPLSVLDKDYGGRGCTVGVNPHSSGLGMGRAFVAYARDAVEDRDIEVLFGTAGKKLIYSGSPLQGDGEVVGIYAEDNSGTIAIKARYGVIIGTGGFDFNEDMVKHYLPAPVSASCAIKTNTGDGHIMAMEVGASMRNMNESYRMAFNMIKDTPLYQASYEELDDGTYGSEEDAARVLTAPGRAGSIMVNKHGERFGNESAAYDMFGRNFEKYDTGYVEWRNIPGYLILDETYQGSFGSGLPSFPQILTSGEIPVYLHKYDTLEALADDMGINKENLLVTVERYNGFCRTGIDLDWSRGVTSWDRNTCGNASRVESGEIVNPCLAPLTTGPFYCVRVYPGILQTKGGMEINGNAQVLNVRGEAIPRLYAASNCIANPLGKGYGWGGSTVVNGYIVGYVAGNHIATLQPWE